jgi:GH15 family glucan-1,4-alpha-glucosidase
MMISCRLWKKNHPNSKKQPKDLLNRKSEVSSSQDTDQAPPINDYGFIGDCHSVALISKAGSIDWCCMPRIDSASCFGRLIGWKNAGYCQVMPTAPFDSSHHYLDDTMVLITEFKTETGKARVYDFFPMRRGGAFTPYQQIIRIIEGVHGQVEFRLDIVPRFDYGAVRPWLKPYKRTAFIALGGCHGLLISGDMKFSLENYHQLVSTIQVSPGERHYLSLLYRSPEDLDNMVTEVPSNNELDFRLDETTLWWQNWGKQGEFKGPYAHQIKRSAIILKSLSNAPTGAIAAAPTTSLPEEIGGIRNWDYRFSWIRDSYFSVRSLGRLGFINEADGFRRFIERSSHGSPDGLQTLFGVHGERRLREHAIPDLEGYRGSKPVRVGNEAANQLQLDMYGLLLDLAWIWHKKGISPNKEYWSYLESIVNYTMDRWRCQDCGIWEMRNDPRHFVHSKMMCWVALDRGIRLAQALGYRVPLEKWVEERRLIRETIEERGYDHERGVFIQAFDHPQMDASLLLLPAFGFVKYKDERMVRTLSKIREELEVDGLLKRYLCGSDNLAGSEGSFLACTFWLVICLAKQGQLDEAKKLFAGACSTCNELYLFSEEYDAKTREMLGNFPQGFTHLSFIVAAISLYEEDDSIRKKRKKY